MGGFLGVDEGVENRDIVVSRMPVGPVVDGGSEPGGITGGGIVEACGCSTLKNFANRASSSFGVCGAMWRTTRKRRTSSADRRPVPLSKHSQSDARWEVGVAGLRRNFECDVASFISGNVPIQHPLRQSVRLI